MSKSHLNDVQLIIKMKSNKIKVSIIIPVYNTEKYIRQTVESIMSQTLKELEIIIINDGSTDESMKIVEELALHDNRIQTYSQANQGVSVARNKGIAHAQENISTFWIVMICSIRTLLKCATINVKKKNWTLSFLMPILLEKMVSPTLLN